MNAGEQEAFDSHEAGQEGSDQNDSDNNGSELNDSEAPSSNLNEAPISDSQETPISESNEAINTNSVNKESFEIANRAESADSVESELNTNIESSDEWDKLSVSMTKPVESAEQFENDRESLSYEAPEMKPNEWSNIEIETNIDDVEAPELNSYNSYHKESDENVDDSKEENIEIEIDTPIDLTNDIAINQMLADQGATHDPDAETFDVNLYNLEAEELDVSPEVNSDTEPKSFDYLPYHHQNTGETHSNIK